MPQVRPTPGTYAGCLILQAADYDENVLIKDYSLRQYKPSPLGTQMAAESVPYDSPRSSTLHEVRTSGYCYEPYLTNSTALYSIPTSKHPLLQAPEVCRGFPGGAAILIWADLVRLHIWTIKAALVCVSTGY